MDKIYITLKGDEYFGNVQCFFTPGHASRAARLSKGQYVKVRGMVDGKMMNVLLKGCILQ